MKRYNALLIVSNKMKFTDLSAAEQHKARELFEKGVREEIICYLEECGQEVIYDFVEEEVRRITEPSLMEDDEDWDDVASWQLDWFRKYVAAYGSIYELYNPDD